jgi:hypothetical protein
VPEAVPRMIANANVVLVNVVFLLEDRRIKRPRAIKVAILPAFAPRGQEAIA